MTVAALYVDPRGVYAGLPDVDVWDEARDARRYAGPHPVVAHPPCARWSQLAGFTEARFGLKRGADGGCFAAALEAVRRFGGVLEHPAYTAAFAAYGLPRPYWYGGWSVMLDGGATCYVEQGRYGLPVKKATWLYAYGVELPELEWGATPPDGDGEEPNGEHGGIENWSDRWVKPVPLEDANSWWKQNRRNGLRSRTPEAFRDVLLGMARSASTGVAA